MLAGRKRFAIKNIFEQDLMETLSNSACRALSSIFTKSIKKGGLSECCVSSISEYSSMAWGYQRCDPTLKIHLRVARFFLTGRSINADIQKHHSSLARLVEVFFGIRGNVFKKLPLLCTDIIGKSCPFHQHKCVENHALIIVKSNYMHDKWWNI